MACEVFQRPETWDASAADYELNAEPFTRQYAARALQLAGGVRRGEAVLDIAAGTGALAVQAAEAGAAVLATDFSPGMVSRLSARLQAGAFTPASRAEVMDGQALAISDSAFDAAFCIFGVMMFPDPPRGLSEMRRVLKPGGRAVVATWSDPFGGGPSPLFMRTFRTMFPDETPPAFPAYIERWTDLFLLGEDMQAAGFSTVEVSAWTGVWTLASVEAARSSMVRFFGRQPAYAQLTPEQQAAIGDAFAARLPVMADGQVRIESSANFAVARA